MHLALLVFLGMSAAAAQETHQRAGAEAAAAALALREPDEGSPFFAEASLATVEMRAFAQRERQGAVLPDGNAEFPSVRGDEPTALQMFTGFFTGMFASVANPFARPAPATAALRTEPAQFSLADRREFDAVFEVTNRGRRILRLDFPTTQHIEILTRAPGGQVIERWSDDRAFREEEDIIFINPGEKIQYEERIPTREMKAGETYTIEAELTGHSQYRAQTQITPAP